MTWYDDLQTASFRGVPFQVDSVERSEGLNTVLREYPFQDLPTVFSMGQAAGEIKFSAYVIGNEYVSAMNALEKALLVDDSGILVHPSIGSMRVRFHGKVSIKEAFTTEGGMARFEMTFIRAEARRYPVEATNTGMSAFAAALAGITASVQGFVDKYNLKGVAGWVRGNVFDNLVLLHSTMFDVCFAIKQGTDGFDDLVRMGRDASSLLTDTLLIPQDLGAHFASLLKFDKNYTSDQAANAVANLLPIADLQTPAVLLPDGLPMRDPRLTSLLEYTVSPPYSPYATASRVTLADNCAALQTLTHRLAFCALIQAASMASYANYDVALIVRAAINKHGQRLIYEASLEASTLSVGGDRTVHDALMAALTAALTHLHKSSIDLARLTTFTPVDDDSIWSISYQLYGTVDFADEIWTMNQHITNPLLVPAGIELRVINHK